MENKKNAESKSKENDNTFKNVSMKVAMNFSRSKREGERERERENVGKVNCQSRVPCRDAVLQAKWKLPRQTRAGGRLARACLPANCAGAPRLGEDDVSDVMMCMSAS